MLHCQSEKHWKCRFPSGEVDFEPVNLIGGGNDYDDDGGGDDCCDETCSFRHLDEGEDAMKLDCGGCQERLKRCTSNVRNDIPASIQWL